MDSFILYLKPLYEPGNRSKILGIDTLIHSSRFGLNFIEAFYINSEKYGEEYLMTDSVFAFMVLFLFL